MFMNKTRFFHIYNYDEFLFLQNKRTPLHYASKSGNADTLSLLISHGGDIHAVDKVNKYMYLFSFDSSHKYSNI